MNAEQSTDDLPDSQAIQLARASSAELSRLLSERPAADRAHVKLDGRDLILPRRALALLRDLLAEMAQGNAVTVVPTHAELTTQQAADMLNVSRPHLIKLLEKGELPFTRVGTHRRIRYRDVVRFKMQRMEESEDALRELARIAQENDMGY
jgi:excisionase family DNA binding protein